MANNLDDLTRGVGLQSEQLLGQRQPDRQPDNLAFQPTVEGIVGAGSQAAVLGGMQPFDARPIGDWLARTSNLQGKERENVMELFNRMSNPGGLGRAIQSIPQVQAQLFRLPGGEKMMFNWAVLNAMGVKPGSSRAFSTEHGRQAQLASENLLRGMNLQGPELRSAAAYLSQHGDRFMQETPQGFRGRKPVAELQRDLKHGIQVARYAANATGMDAAQALQSFDDLSGRRFGKMTLADQQSFVKSFTQVRAMGNWGSQELMTMMATAGQTAEIQGIPRYAGAMASMRAAAIAGAAPDRDKEQVYKRAERNLITAYTSNTMSGTVGAAMTGVLRLAQSSGIKTDGKQMWQLAQELERTSGARNSQLSQYLQQVESGTVKSFATSGKVADMLRGVGASSMQISGAFADRKSSAQMLAQYAHTDSIRQVQNLHISRAMGTLSRGILQEAYRGDIKRAERGVSQLTAIFNSGNLTGEAPQDIATISKTMDVSGKTAGQLYEAMRRSTAHYRQELSDTLADTRHMVVSRKNYARASAVADVVNLLAPGTDRTDRFASVVRGLITGNMSEQKLSQAIFNMVPAAKQQIANRYLQARAELAGPGLDSDRVAGLRLEVAELRARLQTNDKDASVRTAAVDQLVQEQHKTAAAASSIPNGSLDPQRSPSNAVIQYDLPQTQETVNPYGVATGRQLLHPGGGLQANRVEAR